jgi:phenylpropionate dioxygenase-like ring-hydroxylating dioxygenase large terminal subunit
MLRKELNEALCRTDPGTPGGALLRRYWQPVGLSREVTPGGKPRQVQVMGEPLVLFRDDAGHAALLGLHCSHRLTSLGYGRVEDGGIRCPFHGWLYDRTGRCLEQPAEPEGSTFKDHIQHKAYPCEELGGLIFAYLGPPDRKPLLPRYEVLAREDGTRKTDYYDINSNYLQNVEGALDTVHAAYLHMDQWSKVKADVLRMPKPDLQFTEAEYGIWQRSQMVLPSPTGPWVDLLYAHFFMPAGFLRVQSSTRAGTDVKKFQSWYVPIDDTHTRRFQASFAPFANHPEPYQWPGDEDYQRPGPQNDYFRDYERVDTISGIPVRAPGTAIKGFLCQDNMVNETQGPIAERSEERLGAQDVVLSVMRAIYLKALQDVEQGRDPKHIIRDPAENSIVYIRGTEAHECV